MRLGKRFGGHDVKSNAGNLPAFTARTSASSSTILAAALPRTPSPMMPRVAPGVAATAINFRFGQAAITSAPIRTLFVIAISALPIRSAVWDDSVRS
jgi:hypothetical protein